MSGFHYLLKIQESSVCFVGTQFHLNPLPEEMVHVARFGGEFWCPGIGFDSHGSICALPQPTCSNAHVGHAGGMSSPWSQWIVSQPNTDLATCAVHIHHLQFQVILNLFC